VEQEATHDNVIDKTNEISLKESNEAQIEEMLRERGIMRQGEEKPKKVYKNVLAEGEESNEQPEPKEEPQSKKGMKRDGKAASQGWQEPSKPAAGELHAEEL